MAKKQTEKKPPAKKAPQKKQPPKKSAAKKQPAKKAPAPKASCRKSIAQRQTDWKTGKTANRLRWLAMIPLAMLWYIFTFLLAGYSFSALVCAGIMGLLMIYNICYWASFRHPRAAGLVKRLVTFVLCLGLIVVAATECLIIHASLGDRNESCEYMVVLGAKVRPDGPSVSLMDRITAAADYMKENPQVIAIVSGGQGPDEPMTEAECMYRELVKLGIDPDRIWLEDRASSTWENLRFSLSLIEEKTGQRPEKIGLLSSEYHLFRAKLFARDSGVEAVGIPARTSRLSQMVNHFMREVAGIWHYIILGGQYRD